MASFRNDPARNRKLAPTSSNGRTRQFPPAPSHHPARQLDHTVGKYDPRLSKKNVRTKAILAKTPQTHCEIGYSLRLLWLSTDGCARGVCTQTFNLCKNPNRPKCFSQTGSAVFNDACTALELIHGQSRERKTSATGRQ